jgi:hypothetical protein
MKIKLTITSLLFALAMPVLAQTNAPVASSPIFEFLSTGTNWYAGTYGIYDTTSKQWGGGIGAGYKLSEFVVPIVRLDYIGSQIWVPSGSLQLQVPVTLFGKFTVVPFVFPGIATSLNNYNSGNNGDAVGIFGSGVMLRIPSTKWYVPSDVIADYERWTGGPFKDNQFRLGLSWKI